MALRGSGRWETEFDLRGQVAVVTGGSRGIGAAVCRLLAAAGARVVVGYHRRRADARRTVEGIRRAGGTARAVAADVSDPVQATALVAAAEIHYGRLDILVTSAGIWERGPLLTVSPARWRHTLAVNLDGTFQTVQAGARLMRRAKRGRIVTISSTAGQRGEAFYGQYAASKGAIIALTKSWAVELAPHGIRVNCVAPGWVETEMAAPGLRGRKRRAVERSIPLGRIGRPEEIAAAILFLASDACGFLTGEILNVNGGAVLCG